MKIYSHFGYRDFVICLGYKGYFIKEYFAHYLLHESNVTFDFADSHEAITYDQTVVEPWRVSLVNTGARHHDRRARASASARTSATSRSC